MNSRQNNLLPQSQFPHHALPSLLYRIVWAIAQMTQAPLSMVATFAIAVASEAIQGLVGVQIPKGPYCLLSNWVLVFAPTGLGKTPVLRLLRKPITAFEATLHAKYQEEMELYRTKLRTWELEKSEYEQAIRRAARKSLDTETCKERLAAHMTVKPKEPRNVQLTYSDVTPQALVRGLVGWPNASLVSDEASIFFNGHMANGLAMLNQLWEQQALSIERSTMGQPIFVQNPRVMLIWAAQPSAFARYLERRGPEARELGTMARFLPCQPDCNQGMRNVTPVEVDQKELTDFYDRVTECLHASIGEDGEPLEEQLTVTFCPEAEARYHLFRANIEKALPPGGCLQNMKDYAAKAPRHLARLAGMFEFFETGNALISLDSLERAITVMNWYIWEYGRIFTPQPAIPQEQQDADRLQPWLQQFAQKRGNRYLIKNDVRKHVLSELRDKTRLDRSLGVLMQRGWITQWPAGKVGMIDTMPHTIHDQFAMSAALQTYRSSRTKLSY
ncbi:YfjI family protein [Chromobacterium vaccinii]|uniref:YfjI family protein n=1 Tax=Chromobacterium vaccinii TaxID=1108595 RepID=UPI00345AE8EC